jgi:hypothetical protein
MKPVSAAEGKHAMSLYDLTVKSIDLKPQPLSAYRGKVAW